MKFKKPVSVLALAEKYNMTLKGDKTLLATGINEIHKVKKGDITFVDLEKYYVKSLNSPASIIIIDKDVDCPPGKALLITNNPFLVYDDIVAKERPFFPLNNSNHLDQFIHDSAIVEPGAIVGHRVTIGANCYIQTGAIIHSDVIIGTNTMIQSGAIIGTDAFYFKKNGNSLEKWTSGGRVIIGDNVVIGAGCTINKGVSGDTVVGDGSKFDSQVHLGHGVVVGKNCLFAAQVGIGGKTIIGNNVTLYGQVGIAQNLLIENDVTVLGKSGVTKNLQSGKTYFGYPASEAINKYRELVALRRIGNNQIGI
jgi:UDP-3-O-[3-hydroxymyristoyl] glucosamine N-acyltransferase